MLSVEPDELEVAAGAVIFLMGDGATDGGEDVDGDDSDGGDMVDAAAEKAGGGMDAVRRAGAAGRMDAVARAGAVDGAGAVGVACAPGEVGDGGAAVSPGGGGGTDAVGGGTRVGRFGSSASCDGVPAAESPGVSGPFTAGAGPAPVAGGALGVRG
ncbi:hypothetical protein [Chondromyces crocatus]|uniref:hypothetical protein n=1 Tax=Chondromyces crocatus TaxID=52 RepID=UPI000AD34A24|nr:hypothetical protein [Chondromyces crocatus]